MASFRPNLSENLIGRIPACAVPCHVSLSARSSASRMHRRRRDTGQRSVQDVQVAVPQPPPAARLLVQHPELPVAETRGGNRFGEGSRGGRIPVPAGKALCGASGFQRRLHRGGEVPDAVLPGDPGMPAALPNKGAPRSRHTRPRPRRVSCAGSCPRSTRTARINAGREVAAGAPAGRIGSNPVSFGIRPFSVSASGRIWPARCWLQGPRCQCGKTCATGPDWHNASPNRPCTLSVRRSAAAVAHGQGHDRIDPAG